MRTPHPPSDPLTLPIRLSTLANVEVHFRPETESRLQELAARTGRAPDDLIEDAMAGYPQELARNALCTTLRSLPNISRRIRQPTARCR